MLIGLLFLAFAITFHLFAARIAAGEGYGRQLPAASQCVLVAPLRAGSSCPDCELGAEYRWYGAYFGPVLGYRAAVGGRFGGCCARSGERAPQSGSQCVVQSKSEEGDVSSIT